MVTTKINIDLAKKTTAPVVYAMQNDSDSRVVEAHLFVNGLPFDIGESSLSVLFQKPDGKSGWYDKLPDESNAIEVKDGNIVSAILAPQVLNVAGVVIAAIRVDFADGGILSTFPFKIFVEKDPSFGGVESNDYFNVSNWAEVNEEISNIKGSLSKALVSDEAGNIEVNGASLRGVGALQINPNNDIIGVWLNAEVPEPVEGEKRPTGALSFYDSSYDRAVILRNIADGEGDNDAATVRQLNGALSAKEDTANKVTVIDETATDDQYPSALAVHTALESKNTYTNLYGRVEITEDDITAAGDEGITAITIGSEDVDLSLYDDILLIIYTPVSSPLNSDKGALSVTLTQSSSVSSGDVSKLVCTQSIGLSNACVFEYSQANCFAVKCTFSGDRFLYGEVIKNGYSQSIGYNGVSNGWTRVSEENKKSVNRYFHVFDTKFRFKFPAGSWVEVWGR